MFHYLFISPKGARKAVEMYLQLESTLHYDMKLDFISKGKPHQDKHKTTYFVFSFTFFKQPITYSMVQMRQTPPLTLKPLIGMG